MALTEQYNWKEIKSLIGASLVLGFVFSFIQAGEEFSMSLWLADWFRMFLLSFIVFIIYIIANKSAAKLHGSKITFKIWNVSRFWFSRRSKIKINFLGRRIRSIKMGVFLPILITLFSNGLFKWAAIGYSEIEEVSAQRTGKKHKYLTDFEVSRIHLAGPIACLLLSILLAPAESFSSLVEIAKYVAIFSFIPLGRLDGAKILFGSIPLYLLSLIVIIGSLLLVNIIPALAAFFLALVIAIILMLIYLYRV